MTTLASLTPPHPTPRSLGRTPDSGPGAAEKSRLRLHLNPSVRVLWRSVDVVQFELGARAIVLDGIDGALIGSLTTGGHSPSPRDRSDLAAALSELRAAGFLLPLQSGSELALPPLRSLPPARLAGALAALRARHGSRAEEILRARADASVLIHGTGRLAVAVATLLVAGGVGHVRLQDTGEVRRHDCAPGGLREDDEGRRFAEAAGDALRRASADVDTSDPGDSLLGRQPDLVILATDAPIEEAQRESMHLHSHAHLVLQTRADDAVIGPLVLPGLTSCLRCADLHRLDRDPAWSLLAVQLAARPRHAAPSDIGLASFAASVATLQTMAYLDGDEPATLGATLELRLPDWRLRRRSWAAHADCDCGADSRGGDTNGRGGDELRREWAQ
jgi:hypothetical protein